MSLVATQAELAVASAARTASGNSGPITGAGKMAQVLLMVHCTAASGTSPTLDVSLEQSADGTSWAAITGSAATQLTAAGNRTAGALATANYVRAVWTIGGTDTPTFTFSISVLTAPNA